ncbi:starch synthase [Allochromatium warmingii]|uniref:Glycogen synthase n=1 Tax=Allochromatium warmingii TaxID=61595 RepID=A0A1H3FN95_ALLWA|nr:glycogen synthase [Allochromatium warmingii]SDX92380.1 starch synthase [Allochromatium warmingii]
MAKKTPGTPKSKTSSTATSTPVGSTPPPAPATPVIKKTAARKQTPDAALPAATISTPPPAAEIPAPPPVTAAPPPKPEPEPTIAPMPTPDDPAHTTKPAPRPLSEFGHAPTLALTAASTPAAQPEPEPPAAPHEEPWHAPEPQWEPAAPPVWRPSLFIVHITPELASVAKVGGLADVVFGLTRELAIRGNHVEIILPKYASLRYDQIFELHEVYQDLWVPWYNGAIHCTVFFGFVHGRKCFFIEPHSADNFFNRHSIYGFNDDVLRYAFFSRAAIEFLWKAGKHPDIIHCHDWQTSLVPVHLYEQYQALGMTHPRVCTTIHNFAHQGITGPDLLRATGLHRPEYFFSHTRLGDHRHPNALNLLKGGIVYSNFVTTVSPRYAFETKDQGQGFGLEPVLHTHHIKYGGVVNGIDYDVWNPEVDPHIPVQYGVDSLERKYDNKRALRQRLMLADNEKAIVAFIGRLDPQKGLELVRHAIFNTLERGAQFVLLGSSPDDRINADFWGLKRMLNDSPDCHLEIGFDEDLSHLIYAGADMMLVPSRFEPCGLTQLIALRYGTIPVVRTVGGLADTIFDKDHSNRPLHERNGYVFNDYDHRGLESALGRAIDCYNAFPEHFRELMKNAMRCDYSWNQPGQDYLNIYDYIRDV